MATLAAAGAYDDLVRRLCYAAADHDLYPFLCRFCRRSMHSAGSIKTRQSSHHTTAWLASTSVHASQAPNNHVHTCSPTRYCAICDALGHATQSSVTCSATNARDTKAPGPRGAWRPWTPPLDELCSSRRPEVHRTSQFYAADPDTDDTEDTDKLFEVGPKLENVRQLTEILLRDMMRWKSSSSRCRVTSLWEVAARLDSSFLPHTKTNPFGVPR